MKVDPENFTVKANVLDHGFVMVRNIAGPTRRRDCFYDADDIDPANAARMSFDGMDKGRTREADLKLSRYLMKNWHHSPFEMVECWIEMKLPIFVARQFVRHRTTSLNEISGRYVKLPEEWYIPDLRNVKFQVSDKKQGGGAINLDDKEQIEEAKCYINALDETCRASYGEYENAIKRGIAHEQARLFLHLNHYTHWLWKQNLHNLFHFLALRDHSHAQGESAQYARVISDIMNRFLPHSIELYREYRRMA